MLSGILGIVGCAMYLLIPQLGLVDKIEVRPLAILIAALVSIVPCALGIVLYAIGAIRRRKGKVAPQSRGTALVNALGLALAVGVLVVCCMNLPFGWPYSL